MFDAAAALAVVTSPCQFLELIHINRFIIRHLPANPVIQSHQLDSSVTMGKAAPQQLGVSENPRNTETQVQKSEFVIGARETVTQSQQSAYSVTSVDAGRLALQPQQNRGPIQDKNQN